MEKNNQTNQRENIIFQKSFKKTFNLNYLVSKLFQQAFFSP